MGTIIVILALLAYGWLIWKTPPPVRTTLAMLAVILTAYSATELARKVERAEIQNTYFRGLSMTLWELNHLAEMNEYNELAAKLKVLNRDFPGTTADDAEFNVLMNKMINPTWTWNE